MDDDLNIFRGFGRGVRIGQGFQPVDRCRPVDVPARRGLCSPGVSDMSRVLAFSAGEEGVPDDVRDILTRRAEARAKKEWALSDALRDQLLATGWQVKDTKEGQKLSRKG